MLSTVFFLQSNENIYPKGRALMKMYRVVPQTKRAKGKEHNLMILFYLSKCKIAAEFLVRSYKPIMYMEMTYSCIVLRP